MRSAFYLYVALKLCLGLALALPWVSELCFPAGGQAAVEQPIAAGRQTPLP